jgi:hypothetical protein
MISKLKLITFISLILLTSCKTNTSFVRIKGRAYYSKAGACIVTKKGEIYYIKGLGEWPENYSEKKLVVTGKLTILYDTAISENNGRQRITIKQDLDSAKYRITTFGFVKKPLSLE